MATPTFVKFSKIRYSTSDALKRLQAEVFDPWNVTFESAGQLRKSHIKFDGGLELVDDRLYACDSEFAALNMASDWEGLGLVYQVRAVPCNVFLYFFDMRADEFACTLSFDSSLVYFESNDFKKGQWLRGFLAAMVAGLRADVCGYGPDDAYAIKHESLDTEQVLSRLRNGSLLKISNPVFHAISFGVISREEITELTQHLPENPKVEYAATTAGYYIFSALP